MEKSKIWIDTIKAESVNIAQMSISDSNQLHSKTLNPPVYITKRDKEQLMIIVSKIEEHLETLALDWLIEKFKELNMSSQKKFIKIISDLVREN